MITIKSEADILKMRESGKILSACRREIGELIEPGITLLEIDKFAEDFILKHGAYPEQKGYNGYKYATCLSVNDVVCHGIPTKQKLKRGDIISVDMVVNLNGWLADSAWSYSVGEVSEEANKLLSVAHECLYKGIEQAFIGKRLGDIGSNIQKHAESFGFSVVRDYIGHGIGKEMHEEPDVHHIGKEGRGMRLLEGMVFTIEPMINVGYYKTILDTDGWTAKTADGSLSAQYEHTIAITKNGPVIITE